MTSAPPLRIETRGSSTFVVCPDCRRDDHVGPTARIRHSSRCGCSYLQPTGQEGTPAPAPVMPATETPATKTITAFDAARAAGVHYAARRDWERIMNSDF